MKGHTSAVDQQAPSQFLSYRLALRRRGAAMWGGRGTVKPRRVRTVLRSGPTFYMISAVWLSSVGSLVYLWLSLH